MRALTRLSLCLFVGAGCAEPELIEPAPVAVEPDAAAIAELMANPHTNRLVLQGLIEPDQSRTDAFVPGRFLGFTVSPSAGETVDVTVLPEGDRVAEVFLYGPDVGRGFAALRRITNARGGAAQGGARIAQRVAMGGTYVVIVGEATGQRGAFTISRAHGNAAARAALATQPLATTPSVTQASTGAVSRFDRYLCDASRARPGGEAAFTIDVTEEGFLGLALDGASTSALDVFLLRSESALDCIDGGGATAGAWVTPGRYVVVVDNSVTQPKTFTLRSSLTTLSRLEDEAMNVEVGRRGLRAFDLAFRRRESRRLLYGMIDFTMHSRYEREWIFDLSTSQLAYSLHVAHGQASSAATDRGMAARFSNTPQSNMSSVGMARTGVTYTGSFGYSVRIQGLEAGYNDKLMARSVVIHPWFGSRPDFVRSQRYAAPTWGCPAVSDALPRAFFDTISNGMLLWSYFNDGDWSERSSYLRD